jgi:antitoxin ParD1/3/4
MNVRLNAATRKFVSDGVASGAFRSADDMIEQGLLLLKQREQLRRLKLEALRREISVADEQFRRGQYTEFTVHTIDELSDWVRKEGRRRLSKRRRSAG